MEATLLIKDVKNYIKGLAPTETPYIFPKKDKKLLCLQSETPSNR